MGYGGIESTYIGRYRGKHGYITCTIKTAYLTNFRAELIYSPTIIKRIFYGYAEHPEEIQLTPEYISKSRVPLDGSAESRQKAEKLAEVLNSIAQEEREALLEKIRRQQTKTVSPKDDSLET